jgi:hypothetical protein
MRRLNDDWRVAPRFVKRKMAEVAGKSETYLFSPTEVVRYQQIFGVIFFRLSLKRKILLT